MNKHEFIPYKDHVNKKFFSIITPFKDREHLMNDYFECLSKQSFTDFEIVISVDSGSKLSFKKTKKILKDIHNKFFKENNLNIIEVPKREDNQLSSSGRARNFAINAARGEWLTFLDSDDLFTKNKLVTLYDLIKSNNHINFFTHDYRQQDFISNSEYDVTVNKSDISFKNLLFLKFHFLPSATCFKRSAIELSGLFSLRYRRGQDWDWYLRLLDNELISHHHINQILTLRIIDGLNSSDKDFSKNLQFKKKIFYSHLFSLENKRKSLVKIISFIVSLNFKIFKYLIIIEPLKKIIKNK